MLAISNRCTPISTTHRCNTAAMYKILVKISDLFVRRGAQLECGHSDWGGKSASSTTGLIPTQ